jgi:hypothetical protein
MTLKPNYLRGFLKTLGYFFVLIMFFSGVIPFLQGHLVDWSAIASMAVFGGAFLAVCACVMFTPREISWDEEKISLRVNFPKSGEYTWRQLEAYSSWSGEFTTFLLKLEGMQAYQIVSVCFSSTDWKDFQSFLRSRYPEKKTWVWVGPIPIRFGKK